MSDTPRTDEADDVTMRYSVRFERVRDLCRKLERDNAALRKRADEAYPRLPPWLERGTAPIDQLRELVKGDWKLVISSNDEVYMIDLYLDDGGIRELACEPEMATALAKALEKVQQ